MRPTLFRTRACVVCRKPSLVKLNADQLAAWLDRGEPIQVAFPNLTASERELLISGTHPACWDVLFPKDEQDEAVETIAVLLFAPPRIVH